MLIDPLEIAIRIFQHWEFFGIRCFSARSLHGSIAVALIAIAVQQFNNTIQVHTPGTLGVMTGVRVLCSPRTANVVLSNLHVSTSSTAVVLLRKTGIFLTTSLGSQSSLSCLVKFALCQPRHQRSQHFPFRHHPSSTHSFTRSMHLGATIARNLIRHRLHNTTAALMKLYVVSVKPPTSSIDIPISCMV